MKTKMFDTNFDLNTQNELKVSDNDDVSFLPNMITQENNNISFLSEQNKLYSSKTLLQPNINFSVQVSLIGSK